MNTARRDPFIFVIMPFDPLFDQIYTNIQTLASLFGGTARRADAAQREGRSISEQIVRMTRKADLIIADLTLANPNIYYEIGYAHAIGKPVFMIARDLTNVAFDARFYQINQYGDQIDIRKFSDVIMKPMRAMLDDALTATSLRQPIMNTLDSIDSMEEPQNDLFCEIMRSYLSGMEERAHQWSTGRVYVDQAEAITKGIEVFRRLRKGGFVTFLVKINEFWSSTDTYAQECRIAARKPNVVIDRVFVAPDFNSLLQPALRDRIDMDERSGIHTYIALSRTIETDAVHDFGIWDDSVLCLIDTNPVRPHEVNGATFSRLPNELASARSWQQKIQAKAVPAPIFMQKIDEMSSMNPHLGMLLRSADYMADQSRDLCHGSYLGKDGCLWYHQAWQYLRILDMVSTPDRHATFYQASLKEAIGRENVGDILISGTADYGTLQQVYTATPAEKMRQLRIHVLDLCSTPIRICEWYARAIRQPNQAIPRLIPLEEDVLTTNFPDSSVDVIVTDAFLTRFTSAEKIGVVKEWSRILKPGGAVITTARIANGAQPDSSGLIRSRAQEAEDFANRAVRTAHDLGSWFPITLSDLYSLARMYAERITSIPFSNEKALTQLFSENGFQIRSMNASLVKGEFHPTTQYGQMYAEKLGRS